MEKMEDMALKPEDCELSGKAKAELAEAVDKEISFNFSMAKQAENAKAWSALQEKAAKMDDEATAPRFWTNEKLIPERVVRKVDPAIFLQQYIHPFLISLSKAIATARLAGKEFKIVAYIRFPNYTQLGNKGEKANEGMATGTKNETESKGENPTETHPDHLQEAVRGLEGA